MLTSAFTAAASEVWDVVHASPALHLQQPPARNKSPGCYCACGSPPVAKVPYAVLKAMQLTGYTMSLPPSLRRWHLKAYFFACSQAYKAYHFAALLCALYHLQVYDFQLPEALCTSAQYHTKTDPAHMLPFSRPCFASSPHQSLQLPTQMLLHAKNRPHFW